jgi:exonuclease III
MNKKLLLREGIESNPGPEKMGGLIVRSFNVRGLTTSKDKVRHVIRDARKLVKSKQGIICLQETHAPNKKHIEALWGDKCLLNNGEKSRNGVAILLSEHWIVNDVIMDNEGRYIIANVQNNFNKGLNLIIANIYAPNSVKEATKFFNRLLLQVEAFADKNVSNNPQTILMGDFNCPANKEDRSSGMMSMEEINLAEYLESNLSKMNLLDIAYHDKDTSKFTWTGKRNSKITFTRIDRIYATAEMANRCTKMYKTWRIVNSDHAAITCMFKTNDRTRGKGIFKLNGLCLKNSATSEKILNELVQWTDNIPNKWNPHMKWDYCKLALRSIAPPIYKRQAYEDDKKSEELISNITHINNSLPKTSERAIREQMIEDRDRCINELECLQIKQAEILALKAGIKWREDGEKSSKYFLGLIKKKYEDSYVDELRDTNGNIQSGSEEKIKVAVTFYENLYRKLGPTATKDRIKNMLHAFIDTNMKRINIAEKKTMDSKLSLEEMRNALRSCKESAPGEDGIPYSYYKKFSSILLPLLLESWNYSLEIGSLPKCQSMSIISLLPKKGKPKDEIANWRPISLTNCDLKIITKAYALRLSKVLPTIIDPSQAAYVPDRRITDNLRLIKIAQSRLKELNKSSAIVSLDVKKAYDSLNHEYMVAILEEYGFGDKFVDVIKVLYNSNLAKVLLNGNFSNEFNLERGVKQGDALSCGLFIIALNPLLVKLNSCKEITNSTYGDAILKLLPRCLAYADDVTVLCSTNKGSIKAIFRIYEQFTNFSGLELNAGKTEILIVNAKEDYQFNVNYMFQSKQLQLEV